MQDTRTYPQTIPVSYRQLKRQRLSNLDRNNCCLLLATHLSDWWSLYGHDRKGVRSTNTPKRLFELPENCVSCMCTVLRDNNKPNTIVNVNCFSQRFKTKQWYKTMSVREPARSKQTASMSSHRSTNGTDEGSLADEILLWNGTGFLLPDYEDGGRGGWLSWNTNAAAVVATATKGWRSCDDCMLTGRKNRTNLPGSR